MINLFVSTNYFFSLISKEDRLERERERERNSRVFSLIPCTERELTDKNHRV